MKDELYNISPAKVVKFIKKRYNLLTIKGGRLLTQEDAINNRLKIGEVRDKVLKGEPLYDALKGFDGLKYTERVAEYAFLTSLLKEFKDIDVLDVGCVLNNPVVIDVIKKHCTSVWFCNIAVEPICLDTPVYYHISTLEKADLTGHKFPLVTCLSTIEHIGYDNSQYESFIPAEYTTPQIEPLVNSVKKLTTFVAPKGILYVSVPYGYREVTIHPHTGKGYSQIFDYQSMQSATKAIESMGFKTELIIFEATGNGWEKSKDPENCKPVYGAKTPGAGAVAIIKAVAP